MLHIHLLGIESGNEGNNSLTRLQNAVLPVSRGPG